MEGPLCEAGIEKNHKGHESLQVKKTSKQNSLQFKNLDDQVNYNHIVPYMLNNEAMLFIETQFQPAAPKGAKLCKTCKRSITVASGNIVYRLPREYAGVFCSIGCKMTYLTTRSGEHDPEMVDFLMCPLSG